MAQITSLIYLKKLLEIAKMVLEFFIIMLHLSPMLSNMTLVDYPLQMMIQ